VIKFHFGHCKNQKRHWCWIASSEVRSHRIQHGSRLRGRLDAIDGRNRDNSFVRGVNVKKLRHVPRTLCVALCDPIWILDTFEREG
jgi:hypothetical protein